MTQQVKKKLNDSWGMRWGALAIVAFTMMAVCLRLLQPTMVLDGQVVIMEYTQVPTAF